MKEAKKTNSSVSINLSSGTSLSDWSQQPPKVRGATLNVSPQPSGLHNKLQASSQSPVKSSGTQFSVATSPMLNETPNAHVHKEGVWRPVKEVTVCNFKAVRKATISLGNEITILVGANACGKSSIMQAIHWSTRSTANAFSKSSDDGSGEISFDKLDYVPSCDPIRTLNSDTTDDESILPAIKVIFHHYSKGTLDTEVELQVLQETSSINILIEGDSSLKLYMKSERFTSAYIPGLVGLSEMEKKETKKDVWRNASSGRAGSSLRNVLLLLSTTEFDDAETDVNAGRHRLSELNALIGEIFPKLKIEVKYNDSFDTHISVNICHEDDQRWTLDSVSSGILKVIQIFAYIVYFRPKITLIEEPDSLLDPRIQRHLIQMLERIAKRYETQIMVTTHSHYLVQGASDNCKVVWLKNGDVVPVNDKSVRNLMGWNGLSISIVFFVEDEDCTAIRSILMQWPDIYSRVGICSCEGYDNLPRAKLVKGMQQENILDVKYLIHRDGDFMTESQARKWKKKYSDSNAFLWITHGSDIEEYFCSPEYLSALYGISGQEADAWINEALDIIDRNNKSKNEAKDKFINKRKHNFSYLKTGNHEQEGKREFHRSSEEIWDNEGVSTETVTGKTLHEYLVIVVNENGQNGSLLDSFRIPAGYDKVAEDLKDKISEAISSELSSP